MSVVCSGSVAYDYLMSFPGYFRDHILPEQIDCLSLSFLVDTMVKQRGGTAPNIAYTMALLGEKPRLVATVGEDFEEYRNWLESKGIDTTYVRVVAGKYTASFFANTDLSNAQICTFYTGAMANASEVSIKEIQPKPEMVIISPDDPLAMKSHAEQCVELGVPYLYDPSQQVVRLDAESLREGVEGAHSLFVNEYEFNLLQKHTGLTPKAIQDKVTFMVVTCGKRGAVVYADGKEFQIKTVPPRALVEPTGVGDAFRAGFVVGYRRGFDWQTCGQMGALAATYVLEQRGTQSHFYTPEDFVNRYRENFDDQGVLDALLVAF